VSIAVPALLGQTNPVFRTQDGISQQNTTSRNDSDSPQEIALRRTADAGSDEQAGAQPLTIFRAPNVAVNKKHELPNAPSYEYHPLTPKQKFDYFVQYAKSPYTFGSALVTAATWHAYGEPPYGPGMPGFGKSYAAALSQREIAAMLQRWAVPTLFHEDPRYFRAPAGENILQRGMYAVSRVVLTKADNGSDRLNCSYLLGGFATAAIGNAYIRNRDYPTVTQGFFLNMVNDAAFNLTREFWPSIRPKNTRSKIRRLGDLLIGPQGLPNPKSPETTDRDR